MAFWNAPLRDPDHALQACRAALNMQAEISRLNAARASSAEPVRLGIGLNTGSCVVGNVGSPQRFDYSVLGDVVNTASRIEEATKIYGVPIIISETTAAAVPDLAIAGIGIVSLRGKERPEQLYAVLGDEALASHPRFADLKESFSAYSAATAAGDTDAARRHLDACQDLGIAEARMVLEAAALRLTA